MKYSKKLIKQIADDLLKGIGRVTAVKNANIKYQTFLDWIDGKIPEKVLKRCKTPTLRKKKKYEFSELIKRAEQEYRQSLKELAEISVVSHMEKNWTAAAWYLERKHPDEYAQSNKHEIDDKRQPVKETTTLLPPIDHATNSSYKPSLDPAGRATKKIPRVDSK